MSITTVRDLDGIIRAGAIVAEVLRDVRACVAAGVTTADLDAVAAGILRARGGRSAPHLEYGFPGTILVSVNDEAVHGVPGARRIQAGDVVKIDATVEADGYVADAAVTVALDPVAPAVRALVEGTEAALARALDEVRAGRPIGAIGDAVAGEARRRNLSVIRELTGHGVGRRIHEPPEVPNFPGAGRGTLTENLVLAIEPILTTGSGRVVTASDGWTIRTADGAPAAHFEHTVIVTRGRPIIVTAPTAAAA